MPKKKSASVKKTKSAEKKLAAGKTIVKKNDHALKSAPYVPELNWTIFLNGCFGIIEFMGGLLTNSTMLLTDAVHDLGDCLSLIVAKIVDKDATRGRTKNYTYGYKRLTLFSTFVASMIALIAAALMLPFVLRRLANPEMINTMPVIILAIVGCVVHAIVILSFKRGRSRGKKLAFYNLVEDLVGWLAVLAAGLVILVFEVPILDPIMSLVMILFMLMSAIRNFYVVLSTFLQAVPAKVDIDEVTEKILGLPYVNEVMDFHVWTLDGEDNVASIYIKVDKDLTWKRRDMIKKEVRECLAKQGVKHVTVELDETKSNVNEESFK